MSGQLNPLSWADRWADQVSLLKGWSAIGWSAEMADLSKNAAQRLLQGWCTIGWSMYMAYLLIKNADLLPNDLYT